MASGEKDRPTTVNALVYAFYGLGMLVVVVAALWLSGVVPGWVVPAVLVVTVIVFAGRFPVALLQRVRLAKP